MLKVFTLGAVAALSLSTGASAQLFAGGFGDNTLGPEYVITFAADGSNDCVEFGLLDGPRSL
jgi:hypothetical protein